MYEELNGGEFAAERTEKVMEELGEPEKKAFLIGLDEYKRELGDYDTPLDQKSALELLSSLLSVNILVLDTESKPIVYMYGREPVVAREMASMYAKTVVLTTSDDDHYSLVVKGTDETMNTLFDTEDPIVQDILNEGYPLLSDDDFSDL